MFDWLFDLELVSEINFKSLDICLLTVKTLTELNTFITSAGKNKLLWNKIKKKKSGNKLINEFIKHTSSLNLGRKTKDRETAWFLDFQLEFRFCGIFISDLIDMALIVKPVPDVKDSDSNRQYEKLKSNPMFRELQVTLIRDVQRTTNIPVTLMERRRRDDSNTELDPALVAIQEANLQSEFQQIIPTGNSKIFELQNFYNTQCAAIEKERNEEIENLKEQNMLGVSAYQLQLEKIHLDHDQQRMHLTNRVTASLELLKMSIPVPNVGDNNRSRSRQLNSRAVAIMTDWYERHIDSPYPSDEEKMMLAERGNLTLSQVKAWFANKRNRTSNTKPKKQKIQVEKQLLNICKGLVNDTPSQTPMLYGDIIQQLSDIVNSSQVFNPNLRPNLNLSGGSGDELENGHSD